MNRFIFGGLNLETTLNSPMGAANDKSTAAFAFYRLLLFCMDSRQKVRKCNSGKAKLMLGYLT